MVAGGLDSTLRATTPALPAGVGEPGDAFVVTRLPPGPRTPALVQTVWMQREPLGFLQRLDRFGDTFTLRVLPVGELVVTSDPSVVETLFGDPVTFAAGEANGRILPILDCHSLLLSDGDAHRARRQLLAPAFHGTHVTRLHDHIVRVAETELDRWPVGKPLRLLPSMRAITLDVIVQASVDIRDAQQRAELVAGVRRMLAPASSAALWLKRRDHRSRWSPGRVFERRRAAVHALIGHEMRRRRDHDAGPNDDVLSVLMGALDADGRPLADADVRDEIATMLIAGHETTSVGLTWAFERLLRHSGMLGRLRSELAAGQDVYLDAVVKETLRVRPPLTDAVRVVTTPVRLAGHDLPPGTMIMIAIPLVHARADLFSEPRTFKPERFLGTSHPPHHWIPFGGGARRCIGAALASFEMATVISTVLARADLHPARPAPEDTRLFGTALVPSAGGAVILDRRLGRDEPRWRS